MESKKLPSEIHPLYLVREDAVSPQDGTENEPSGVSNNLPGQSWIPVGESSGTSDSSHHQIPSDTNSVWMQLLYSSKI